MTPPEGPIGKKLLWAAAATGASGLLAQMVLLRELLVVFAGNELTIGIILANWLALEAGGSFLARHLEQRNPEPGLFRYCLASLAFCAALLPALGAVRMIKPLLGLSVGTVPGLSTAAASTFLALAPVAITHGTLFTWGCSMAFSKGSPEGLLPGEALPARGLPASSIYIPETAGTFLAGLLWTWILVPRTGSFQVMTGIILLQSVTVIALTIPLPGSRPGPHGRRAPGALPGALALAAGAILFLGSGGAERLHQLSIQALWQGQTIFHYENSPEGNIAITENQGQYTFFTDGTPAFIQPIPDITLVEPLVHIAMTAHPGPETILLAGGGASGVLEELLLHPSVRLITYTELEPRLLELQHRIAARTRESWADDPRVLLQARDARRVLQESDHPYDLIISRTSDPSNLHSNRYFSTEFLGLAARSLTDRGILVLAVPGLVGHLTEPLRDLSASLVRTLRQEFPWLRAFPGEGQSFILASRDPAIIHLDQEVFADRLRQRGLLSGGTVPWYIEQRLHPRWHHWFEEFAAPGTARVNRDFRPRPLLLSIAHWSRLNAPLTGRFLEMIYGLHPGLIALATVLILLLPGAALNRLAPGREHPVIPSVVTTGFAAMVMNLSLLFAFQVLAGRLLGWLGLLSAVFISGLGAGAFVSRGRLARTGGAPRRVREMFVRSEVGVLLFSSLLLILIPLAAPVVSGRIPPAVLRGAFLLLFPVAGMVCGGQFPLACETLLEGGSRNRERAPASTAGLVYGADLAGGCIGGILGGLLVLPLLGLTGAGVLLGLVKSGTLLILLLRGPRRTV
ncbi:hypothetical protein AU468_14400 [Alkalispirochaeta sphaeroplastigenens]|uniref:Polyamine aminopropyltransferase n=1 Tax=Alkalispirochaeta sphaeroplastigenens TaxID=1187066 RepID=A0A2S4JEZ9_9SPIO|nr:hypothetical protein [Alkalispirochaeta sphaeroplastigenens]POQ98144.1 hypothetical protein AU468_14400 [Alkalispirochaeta sphaeroplastigenens]